MRKQLLVMLVLLAGAFASCSVYDAATTTEATCQGFVDDGRYINAGCCYKQLGIWDKCVLYMLKGGREAEILWDLGEGSYQQGGIAKEAYSPVYYPSSKLGSDTGVCLNGYGDAALISDMNAYHDWIMYYSFGGAETPPFDMGARVAALERAIAPPAKPDEPEAQCQSMYWFDSSSRACGQKEFCGAYMYYGLQTFGTLPECQAALAAAYPPETKPEPVASETNWLLIAVVAVVIAAAAFFFLKGGKAAPARKEPTPPARGSGYLQRKALEAKREHAKAHKKR